MQMLPAVEADPAVFTVLVILNTGRLLLYIFTCDFFRHPRGKSCQVFCENKGELRVTLEEKFNSLSRKLPREARLLKARRHGHARLSRQRQNFSRKSTAGGHSRFTHQ